MGFRDLFRRADAPTSSAIEPTLSAPSEGRPQAAVQYAGPGRLITSSAELGDYLRGSGQQTGAGVAVTSQAAMQVPPVFACVRIISGAIATLPLGIKRRVDDRTRSDASDHPLWKLLRRRPNRWMTPSAFRRMAQMHLLLRGNAYALKVKDARGDVIELLPMHPDRVEVKQLDDLSLVYTYTRKDGRRLVLPQADVMHLVGMTLDGVTGISVIAYARETLGLAIATERHGANMFRNGATVGAILKHDKQLGPEGQANLRASLEAYRGAENAGRTLILEEGMGYEQLGMSAEDAQFIETRKFSRSDIAMFFGVPPHMIGDTEKSTSWGTGIEQQSQGFVAYTLQDWLTTWEETINRDLIREQDPDVFAHFNLAGLVRGDMKTRYTSYQVGRSGGWLSVNDIRALEDMNPVEGGDVYLEPLNMTPIGSRKDDPDDPAPNS